MEEFTAAETADWLGYALADKTQTAKSLRENIASYIKSGMIEADADIEAIAREYEAKFGVREPRLSEV